MGYDTDKKPYSSALNCFESHCAIMSVCVHVRACCLAALAAVNANVQERRERDRNFNGSLSEKSESWRYIWTARDGDSRGVLEFGPSMHCSMILIKVTRALGSAGTSAEWHGGKMPVRLTAAL